jgi:hypothetical protein
LAAQAVEIAVLGALDGEFAAMNSATTNFAPSGLSTNGNDASAGDGESEGLRILSLPLMALLALCLLTPIVLCAIAFPTPFIDLREQIDWGQYFPLYTWKHPPLQSWIAGLVALTGARDAWLYIAVAQLLNALGFFYVAATARRLFGSAGAVAALIALGGGIFFSGSAPTNALNADQLLFPLWSAVLYHGLEALRRNLWRDWIALGIAAGLSLLAKYFSAVLLFALLVNLLRIAPLRQTFRNPRCYVAMAIGAALVLPTAVEVLQHRDTLDYGLLKFGLRPFDLPWVKALIQAVLAPLLYGLPFAAAVGISLWRHTAAVELEHDAPHRLVLSTTIGLFSLIVLLIVFAGLNFHPRYLLGLYGFGILSVLCAVKLSPAALRTCERAAMWGWAIYLPACTAYAIFFVNDRLLEPAPAAAAIIESRWNATYACGPGYILGDNLSSHAIALYYQGRVTGLSLGDYLFAQWVDRDRLRRLGAVIVARPERRLFIDDALRMPNQGPQITLALPYRRTLSWRKHTYIYSFVPPTDCGLVRPGEGTNGASPQPANRG